MICTTIRTLRRPDVLRVDDCFQIKVVQRSDHIQVNHLVHIVVHPHTRRVRITVIIEDVENMRTLVEKP